MKLLTVEQINELEISILMFKCYSGQIPDKLKQLFKSNDTVHKYGTRHSQDCHIPHRSSRLGQYSLSFQGLKIWNSIDKKTKDIKSIFSFKKCIKLNLLSKQGDGSSGKQFPNNPNFRSLLLL